MSGRVASLSVALATIPVLVALAILPFLNPVWLGFEQTRSAAAAWTGWSDAEVRTVTDALLHDLILGPPDFATELDGVPVFDPRERAHMRDVRVVFTGVFGVAAGAALLLVVAWRRSRGAAWVRAGLRLGGSIVAGTVAILAVIFGVAFDAAFEAFHQVFFPAGSYDFDPASARLVQLLPGQLWYETSLAFGLVLFALALGLARLAGRGSGTAGEGRG